MSAGVDLRDFVADVLHRCLEVNVLGPLPEGCEAGYMLHDALVDAGVNLSVETRDVISVRRWGEAAAHLTFLQDADG